MRNITVFAVLVIIKISIPAAGWAETWKNIPVFSVSPGFGMFYGKSDEIVYAPRGFVSPVHSLLVWDMKPVFYYGLQLDYVQLLNRFKFDFFSSLSLKFGIPGNSGYMEDFDWLSKQNDKLTNYSVHDNTTKELFLLNFSAGLSFPIVYGLHLRALFDFSYKRFCFFGQGGYIKYARVLDAVNGIYAPINDNPRRESIPKDEIVINYTQEWLVVSPGISLRYYIIKNLFTELSFQISPLIMCSDLDEHLKLNDQYRDYTQWGIYLKPGFQFSYSVLNWLEFSLECSWQYISGSKGITYKRNPIGSGLYHLTGNAGTGLSLFDTGLFLKINL